jgi:hypothetical protein
MLNTRGIESVFVREDENNWCMANYPGIYGGF